MLALDNLHLSVFLLYTVCTYCIYYMKF